MTIALCKHDGCGREVQARLMCNAHYNQWRRVRVAVTGKPLGHGGNNNRDAIADKMPGTHSELAAAVGLTVSGVVHSVKLMRASDPQMAHIGEWREPQYGVPGSRWLAVFYAGPGKDAKLTKAMKRQAKLEGRRRWRAANINKPRLSGTEALLFKKPKDQPMNDEPTKLDRSRRRILEALANLAPHHSMSASALGHAAYPDSTFRNQQGAALAAARFIRAMLDDGTMQNAVRGYQGTDKGRAELERLQATDTTT